MVVIIKQVKMIHTVTKKKKKSSHSFDCQHSGWLQQLRGVKHRCQKLKNAERLQSVFPKQDWSELVWGGESLLFRTEQWRGQRVSVLSWYSALCCICATLPDHSAVPLHACLAKALSLPSRWPIICWVTAGKRTKSDGWNQTLMTHVSLGLVSWRNCKCCPWDKISGLAFRLKMILHVWNQICRM